MNDWLHLCSVGKNSTKALFTKTATTEKPNNLEAASKNFEDPCRFEGLGLIQ